VGLLEQKYGNLNPQSFLHGCSIANTDSLVYYLAVLKKQKSRNGLYAKGTGKFAFLVYVDLDNLGLIGGDFLVQLLQDGSLHAAWTTPSRPEIDDYGDSALQDFSFICALGYMFDHSMLLVTVYYTGEFLYRIDTLLLLFANGNYLGAFFDASDR